MKRLRFLPFCYNFCELESKILWKSETMLAAKFKFTNWIILSWIFEEHIRLEKFEGEEGYGFRCFKSIISLTNLTINLFEIWEFGMSR